ncbi:MAG TPA: zinc-ribbon domain-containing protein [Bosea sp. (in: a-proteobacteria)]
MIAANKGCVRGSGAECPKPGMHEEPPTDAMLIVCPSCASRYELDGAKLGPDGRKVRCASCQTLWHVAPEPELPEVPSAEETQALLNEELEQAAAIEAQVSALAAEQAVEQAVEPPDEPPVRARRGTGRSAKKKPTKSAKARLQAVSAPVAISLAGLALLGILLWQRDRAARVAPQLASAFEMLGFPVNVRGLKLSAVESGLVEDVAGRFLVVEGDVTNIAKGNTRVPPIEVAVKDAAGQTLYSWKTDPPRNELDPAELMRFRARLAAPPAAGQSVLVRFASAAPAVASGH